jgi:anti-sigma-K factor RskA
MTEHQWLDLAAPYALGALAPDERAGFEAHLAECAICQAEVQALRDVAGLLAHAAPVAAPPPGLRDRVLREARQVRPIGARRTSMVPWLAAAACLVIALGLAGAYLRERAARDALRGALEATRAQRDSADQLVAAILDSTVGTADLAAAGKAPTMRLYWNRARGLVVAAAFDLPPAPAGRTYQLWVIKKGQNPVSLGTFNTGPSGRAIVTLPAPAGLKADLGAVTEEPAGGSPQPTQAPFLAGPWQGI